jgi:mRNA degradation ribonuclease J1/J2
MSYYEIEYDKASKTPWLIDQANDSGIVVRDSEGFIVYDVDFKFLDDFSEELKTEEKERCLANAKLIVDSVNAKQKARDGKA